MTSLPYLHDNWSWLGHRIGEQDQPEMPMPAWVPPIDKRRLAAYNACSAVLDTVSRNHLKVRSGLQNPDKPQPSAEDRLAYREYGDAELFTVQARSAVLGDEQTVVVDVPDPEVDGEGNPVEQQSPERARAEQAQEWLTRWAEKERLPLKMLRAEYSALGQGDGVYVLGWNTAAGRPKLRVRDPGFYFPVLDSIADGEDFPRVVHFAWEERDERDQQITWVHRQTFRMVTRLDDQGRPMPRPLPWHAPGESSALTVLYSYGRWRLDNARTSQLTVNDLAESAAQWLTVDEAGNRVAFIDLDLDFMPVVHIANGDADDEQPWGRPVWWQITQVLEDICASDSDLQTSSSLVGSSALVTKGGGLPPDLEMGPQAHLKLPEGGSAELLDTSRTLVAMTGYVTHLLKRASVNARMPGEVLGRDDLGADVSGYRASLRFSAYKALIRELRMLRSDKYSLLTKFAMRMGQKAGQIPAGPLPQSAVEFGPFLPSDRQGVVEVVAKLLEAKALSLETALKMLVDEAGIPIEDAVEELRRITKRDFAGANLIADVTGDANLAVEYLRNGELGEIPPPPTNQPVAAPPAVGDGVQVRPPGATA